MAKFITIALLLIAVFGCKTKKNPKSFDIKTACLSKYYGYNYGKVANKFVFYDSLIIKDLNVKIYQYNDTGSEKNLHDRGYIILDGSTNNFFVNDSKFAQYADFTIEIRHSLDELKTKYHRQNDSIFNERMFSYKKNRFKIYKEFDDETLSSFINNIPLPQKSLLSRQSLSKIFKFVYYDNDPNMHLLRDTSEIKKDLSIQISNLKNLNSYKKLSADQKRMNNVCLDDFKITL